MLRNGNRDIFWWGQRVLDSEVAELLKDVSTVIVIVEPANYYVNAMFGLSHCFFRISDNLLCAGGRVWKTTLNEASVRFYRDGKLTGQHQDAYELNHGAT